MFNFVRKTGASINTHGNSAIGFSGVYKPFEESTQKKKHQKDADVSYSNYILRSMNGN